ncbi:hypothetical protein G5B30_16565 [Sphingobacterium sp. SGG-5]|uniref:hypothetical protein n=1 Tax=Sphingobacterium sp. SGG-5 TaxID=2710881 RepID=UPI0013EE0C88|nr:hypothetical protein [Sphingobacterium sp. SGG-5]NGM63524.1 hypothetical protein [Sphingobacterium sp. SGG-5]
MADFNTVNRYTLKEWVRHPTTIILIVAVNVIWVLIFVITDSAKDSNKDCLEQVAYLRERVEKLEKQVDDYTKAVMYKDAQIKNRDVIIDSLRYEK